MLDFQLRKKPRCLLKTVLYANAATIASNDKLFVAAYLPLPLNLRQAGCAGLQLSAANVVAARRFRGDPRSVPARRAPTAPPPPRRPSAALTSAAQGRPIPAAAAGAADPLLARPVKPAATLEDSVVVLGLSHNTASDGPASRWARR